MSKVQLEDIARRAAEVLERASSCPNCHATEAHLRDCPIQALIDWAN